VVSSRATKWYYCDTDSEWHNLATANLIWYDTEEALRREHPGLALHEPCR